MKNLLLVTLMCLSIFLAGCMPKDASKGNVKMSQAYTEHSPIAHHQVALEILDASKIWINNFNAGKSEEAANGYTEDATMSALPFGIKMGREEILGFWKPFIESGAGNLVYTNVKVEVIDENTGLLSANWSMNVGRGIIYQEKWEKVDNQWLLTYDDFEVLEQFETPRTNNTPATASHETLEAVINASMVWVNGFNAKDSSICADGYMENASMNAVPFASLHNKTDIHAFWDKLISDGATNLIYHNPTFEEISPGRVKLSSTWSMNIGDGKIYQEKWVKENDKWLLSYDEFKVLQQY